jgi:hypothetical protein
MKVYPNPTKSTAYVSIPTSMTKGGSLTITNRGGEVVQESAFLENNFQLIPIDLSEHPNGLYKVSLNDDLQEVSYDLLNLSQN